MTVKYLPESTPFFKFHALAKTGRDMVHTMVYAPFEHVKAQMVSDLELYTVPEVIDMRQNSETPPSHSFVSELLSWPEDTDQDRETFEEAVTWVAGAMYGGM